MSPADRALGPLPIVCPHCGDELTPAEREGVRCGRCADTGPEPTGSLVAEARALLMRHDEEGWPDTHTTEALRGLASEVERISSELELRRSPGEVERRLSAALEEQRERAERAERDRDSVSRLACAAMSWHDAPGVETADALHRACDCYESGCPLDERTAWSERDAALARLAQLERVADAARGWCASRGLPVAEACAAIDALHAALDAAPAEKG